MNEPTVSVVGVTFEGRDVVLRRLWHEQGASVQARLRRDSKNKYDKHAIAVDALEFGAPGWSQVGFLPRYAAKQIAQYLTGDGEVLVLAGMVRGGNETIGFAVSAFAIADAYNIEPETIEEWERVSRERAMSNRPHGKPHRQKRPQPSQAEVEMRREFGIGTPPNEGTGY